MCSQWDAAKDCEHTVIIFRIISRYHRCSYREDALQKKKDSLCIAAEAVREYYNQIAKLLMSSYIVVNANITLSCDICKRFSRYFQDILNKKLAGTVSAAARKINKKFSKILTVIS